MNQNTPTQKKIDALNQQMLALGIHKKDIIEKFILGSGKGGQKQNKTCSCAYIKHIPTGIEVKCQKTRSKTLNLFLAKRRLCDKIEENLGIYTKQLTKIKKIKKQKKRRARRHTQGDNT